MIEHKRYHVSNNAETSTSNDRSACLVFLHSALLLQNMDGEEKAATGLVDSHQSKRVQDLAETNNWTPPPEYHQVESNRPTTDLPPPPCGIPVVDLNRLIQPEEGGKLESALRSWGVFQAVGHGLPSLLLDEVRNIGRLFFNQSTQEKQRYFSGEVEGYGNDKVQTEGQVLDWSDRLYLQVHPKHKRKMELWPETPLHFRETIDEFSDRSWAVVDVILKASARLLGLEEDSFTRQMGEEAEAYARFNYFARCSIPDQVFGMKAHADGSVVTFILQDPEVEGLQVLNDRHGWVKIPVVPDALLVVVGDELEIMSNGEYQSPMHRVVTSPERERISVAVFYSPGPEEDMEPASGLLEQGKPSLYKKINAKEYADLFFPDFYVGKKAIHWAKA